MIETPQVDSALNFIRHFKVSKKEIKQIKKEFEEAKALKPKEDLDRLKDFQSLTDEVFDFYSEISGRPVNREIMNTYLHYWFDEGFSVPEMKNYIRAQASEDFYVNRPEFFTIARLFPIKDQDHIIRVWDALAYQLSQLKRGEEKKESNREELLKRILHREEPLEIECLKEPYEQFPLVETDELRELCYFFMRLGQESLAEYADRTHQRRLEIYKKYGIKGGHPAQFLKQYSQVR